jgi:hypothetical protein
VLLFHLNVLLIIGLNSPTTTMMPQLSAQQAIVEG